MKNILYQFNEGQAHFGMQTNAKMNLVLNEPKQVALYSNSNTTSKHAPQVERTNTKQPMDNHRGPTPNEKSN